MSNPAEPHDTEPKGREDEWKEAVPYYAKVVERMTIPPGDEILRLVNERSPIDVPDAGILDLGCGTGSLTSRIRRYTSRPITAIDFSSAMLEKFKEKQLPNVRVLQGDATDLRASGIPDNSFTHVLSAFMLQFVPNPSAALKEMLRVVKPGGIVAIAIWSPVDEPTWEGVVRKYADPGYSVPPGWGIPNFPVHDLLEQTGFSDVKTQTFFTTYGFKAYGEMDTFVFEGKHPVIDKVIGPWKDTEYWPTLRKNYLPRLEELYSDPSRMGTEAILCLAVRK
jgi:SAM-dependent methyltransferase